MRWPQGCYRGARAIQSAADLVAESIFGERSRVHASTRITRGEANEGIFVHEVTPGPGSRDVKPTIRRFVEKRTENRAELRIARRLLARQKQPGYQVFPSIYDIRETDEGSSLYMEYCPTERHRTEVFPALAEGIVEAVLHVNNCFPEDVTVTEVARFDKRLVSARSRIGEVDEVMEASSEVSHNAAELLEGVGERLKLLPLVMSHNDVYWPHVSVEETVGGVNCRLIDFGMLGINVAGADFHNFARMAYRDKYLAPVHQEMVAQYAGHTGLPVKDVVFASYAYALIRSGLRVRTRLRNEAVAKASSELGAFGWLEEHVNQLLDG